MTMRKTIPALWLLLASGCAGGMHSYVESLTPEDAKIVGAGIVEFVQARANPNSGGVAVEAPAADALLGPEVRSDLEAAGYKVGDEAHHRLRYQVTPLDDGMLVRLSLDGGDAARFYGREFGKLSPNGPFTLREASR